MSAVWLVARAQVRRHLRSAVALMLLVGLGGGLALAAGAGARRTGSAYERFLATVAADDVVLAEGAPGAGFNYELDLNEVAAFPEVDVAGRMRIMFQRVLDADGRVLAAIDWALLTPIDGVVFRDVNRLDVVDGRLFTEGSTDEVVVGFSLAERLGVGVGDGLVIQLYDRSLLEDVGRAFTMEPSVEVPVTVVGTVAFPGAFPPKEVFWQVFASRAFGDRYGSDVATVEGVQIRLAQGQASVPSFSGRVNELAGGAQQLIQQRETTVGVLRSIRVSVVALTLFAVVVAAAVLLIGVQSIARSLRLASDDHPAMRALGLGRGQMALAGTLHAGVVAVGATALAVITAVTLSPLMPQGVARIAEPDPGVSFDVMVLGGGAAGLLLVLVGAGALTAFGIARAQHRRAVTEGARRPSRIVGGLAATGAGPSVVAGARLALERGRGRTATPLAATIMASAIGMGALVTSLGFGASLDHLLAEPRLVGWGWDAMVGNIYGPDTSQMILPVLRDNPVVAGVSAGTTNLRIVLEGRDGERHSTNVMAFDQLDGAVVPTVLEGRWPQARDEIAVGTSTARLLDVEQGDRVTVIVGEGADARFASLEVVGRIVIPSLNDPNLPELGEGAGMTFAGLRDLIPRALQNLFVVRFAHDATPEQIRQGLEPIPEFLIRTEAYRPRDLDSLSRATNAPLVVSAILALFAAATLGHGLVSSVHRRRRDLATLKTLGFTRRQVRAAVAWQAGILTAASALVAVPLGVVGARWSWRLFAGLVGFQSEPRVPSWTLILLAPIALAVGNVIAAWPATVAARTKPARVLRSE